MNTLNTTFNDTDGNGSITLYVNPFGNGSKYYGKFDRNTITTETLIARIQKRKAGTNELAVQQIAVFLKQEILEALEKGEAVNVMDLGTLYIVPNGKFNGTSFDSGDKPALSVKFTPSQLTQSTVEQIQIKNIKIAEISPVITQIKNQFTGNTEFELSAGKSVLIEGQRLKIAGEKSGIFLCPTDENGKINEDESTFLHCPVITKNTTKNVEFYVPDNAKGKYRILIKTFYANSNTIAKNVKQVFSEIVEVA